MLWNIDLDRHIVISMQGRILHRNDAFAFQADFASGLGSRFDVAKHFSVDGVYQDFSAEDGRGKRNPCRGIDVVSLSFKSDFAAHMDFQKQIAARTSVDPVHSLAFQADTFSVADSCGNAYLQVLYGFGLRILETDDLFTAKSGIVKGNVEFLRADPRPFAGNCPGRTRNLRTLCQNRFR